METRRLKTLVTRINGDGAPNEERQSIQLEHVESWTGRLLDVVAEPQTAEAETSGTACEQGDVLFGKLRPYLAKTHVVMRPSVCGCEFIVMRPNEGAEGRYLRYAISTEQFVDLVNSMSYGAKMPRVSPDAFMALEVSLPDISMQRVVANRLDEETARVDELVAQKERFIELLGEKRTALITYAVTKGLDPDVETKDSGIAWLDRVPLSWGVCRFPDWIDVREGPGILSPAFRDSGVPLVKVGNMRRGTLDLEGCYYLDAEDVRLHWQRFVLEDGDLVISGSASLGESIVVPANAAGSVPYTGLIRLRPRTSVLDRRYLRQVVRSTPVVEQLKCQAAGVGIKHFGPSHLSRVWLPLPPLQEQQAIAEYLDRETALIDELTEATRESVALLKEYRSALISAAVTGKIDVSVHNATEGDSQ